MFGVVGLETAVSDLLKQGRIAGRMHLNKEYHQTNGALQCFYAFSVLFWLYRVLSAMTLDRGSGSDGQRTLNCWFESPARI